jgi:transposase
MAKRVRVQTELTTEELHDRYRRATNAVERTHWQILWLMKEDYTPDEIASMLGYTARWVRTIVQRCNQAGEQGIRDQRRTQPGAPCLLTASQQQELDHALEQPPADGGL